MSGFRQRMGRLRGTADESVTHEEDQKVMEEASTESEHDDRWLKIGVAQRSTSVGSYLIRRKEYALHYQHGTHRLGELREAASYLSVMNEDVANYKAKHILYLDLETTSLGIGTGNVPFMVGMSYLEDEVFVVEQAFIRHPAEEYAMLHDLLSKLKKFNYLATYNGKTFDWPLLQSRMIMNGCDREAWMPLHLDFLHPSRSIWRNTLSSCKLSYIEEERLGIDRGEDVPGSQAPERYFQYLAEGNPDVIADVFIHNESDLLSLVCLSIRFGLLLSGNLFSRIPYPIAGEELIRTGLWLERMKKDDQAEILYRLGVEKQFTPPPALNKLASRDKKAGNWERAVLLWQKALVHSDDKYIVALYEASIELAMYYEHRMKNAALALTYTIRVINRIEQVPIYRMKSSKLTQLTEQLSKRKFRLLRKLEKQKEVR